SSSGLQQAPWMRLLSGYVITVPCEREQKLLCCPDKYENLASLPTAMELIAIAGGVPGVVSKRWKPVTAATATTATAAIGRITRSARGLAMRPGHVGVGDPCWAMSRFARAL